LVGMCAWKMSFNYVRDDGSSGNIDIQWFSGLYWTVYWNLDSLRAHLVSLAPGSRTLNS
jgi:hypothetical protein